MLSLKQSLIEHNSIRLQQEAATWQEAIQVACAPLIASGAIEATYVDSIIASTLQHGPYYILMDGMAMPHSRPEDGVIKDSFSLVTLTKPVVFPDGREVSVLITLAATSSDIHTSVAIPQIIAVFELDAIIQRLVDSENTENVLDIIDEADFSQYVTV